ncbi:MAG: hypothetical protein DRO52_03145 [Candidatus Hecatellales archaeon]|nr:MAG: hypothetical protein DRO52_03145 [Candidatus Hecatellales archaeon]
MDFMRLSLEEVEGKLKSGEVGVCLWGLGRIGLALAGLLAEAGVKVSVLDPNPKLENIVSTGEFHHQEPGLAKLLRKVGKRLTVHSNLKEAASESSILISTVSVEVSSAGSPDYSSLEKFCSKAGLGLKPGSLLIFTGIFTPGITEEFAQPLLEERSGLRAGKDFGLAYSPLKAYPGSILQDLTGKPQLLAGLDGRSLERAEKLFSLFARGGLVKVGSIRTAEAAGLLGEVYLDVEKALANEFARFCDKAGVSFREASQALSKISNLNFQPGLGWGGDSAHASRLLLGEAERLKADVKLVSAARRVNEETLGYVVKTLSKLLRERGKLLSGSRVILLGVSARADVKEDRASPAKLLASTLKRKGAKVRVWDPLYSLEELKSLGYEPAVLWEALPKADCVMVTVAHQAFRKLRDRILSELSAKGGGILFDCSGAGIFADAASDKVVIAGLGL